MDLHYKYDEILQEAPKTYKDYWNTLFDSFHQKTLLRNNWVIKSRDKFFLTQEIDQSKGPFTWNYVIDEYSWMASCYGLQEIERYLGIPPDIEAIIISTMDGMSFAFDSSLIFDQLKELKFAKTYHREEINSIDCVNTYMLFDFGELEIKTRLEEQHYSATLWAKKEDFSQLDLALHQEQSVRVVFEEFGF